LAYTFDIWLCRAEPPSSHSAAYLIHTCRRDGLLSCSLFGWVLYTFSVICVKRSHGPCWTNVKPIG